VVCEVYGIWSRTRLSAYYIYVYSPQEQKYNKHKTG